MAQTEVEESIIRVTRVLLSLQNKNERPTNLSYEIDQLKQALEKLHEALLDLL